MLNHATFKASLFMAAGIIDHETGTRDIRRLCGLYRFMPITATLAIGRGRRDGGRAAAERVPVEGDVLRRSARASTGPLPWLDRALPYIATLGGMFSVAYSLRFIHGVFFGPRRSVCRACRTSRRAGCAFRSSSSCSRAWWSASFRR